MSHRQQELSNIHKRQMFSVKTSQHARRVMWQQQQKLLVPVQTKRNLKQVKLNECDKDETLENCHYYVSEIYIRMVLIIKGQSLGQFCDGCKTFHSCISFLNPCKFNSDCIMESSGLRMSHCWRLKQFQFFPYPFPQ